MIENQLITRRKMETQNGKVMDMLIWWTGKKVNVANFDISGYPLFVRSMMITKTDSIKLEGDDDEQNYVVGIGDNEGMIWFKLPEIITFATNEKYSTQFGAYMIVKE